MIDQTTIVLTSYSRRRRNPIQAPRHLWPERWLLTRNVAGFDRLDVGYLYGTDFDWDVGGTGRVLRDGMCFG